MPSTIISTEERPERPRRAGDGSVPRLVGLPRFNEVLGPVPVTAFTVAGVDFVVDAGGAGASKVIFWITFPLLVTMTSSFSALAPFTGVGFGVVKVGESARLDVTASKDVPVSASGADIVPGSNSETSPSSASTSASSSSSSPSDSSTAPSSSLGT